MVALSTAPPESDSWSTTKVRGALDKARKKDISCGYDPDALRDSVMAGPPGVDDDDDPPDDDAPEEPDAPAGVEGDTEVSFTPVAVAAR
jgi:hypothetical protein